jgi:hypothetical protein
VWRALKTTAFWLRLLKWLEYNVILALTPLVVGTLARSWSATPPPGPSHVPPELLFFALAISATTLGDLREVTAEGAWSIFLRLFSVILSTGALLSAVLYGFWVAGMNHPGLESLAPRMAGGLGAVSLIAQVALGFHEEKQRQWQKPSSTG